MKKPLLKIFSVLLAVSLNGSGLFAVGYTAAFYNDTESSEGNTFEAAMLDFSLKNTWAPQCGPQLNNGEGYLGTTLGENMPFMSTLTKTAGTLPIQYEVRTEKISGDDTFCNALRLDALHTGLGPYSGNLMSYSTATTSTFGTFSFVVKLPFMYSGVPHGQECNVDIVFDGWRNDVANKIDSGFSDEERVELRLKSRMIVLNEFLPRPSGTQYEFDFGNDSSDMPQGEWVEIYNNSDYDFDTAGWYVWDNSGDDANKIYITAANTVPATTVVSAHSFLTVYMNKAVLNNNGDTVKLYDASSALVDSYAYSGADYCSLEPTPGDTNADTTSDTSCTEVPANKSYARIPDGVGAWIDPVPTPGSPNTENEDDGSVVLQNLANEFGAWGSVQVIDIETDNDDIDNPESEEMAEETTLSSEEKGVIEEDGSDIDNDIDKDIDNNDDDTKMADQSVQMDNPEEGESSDTSDEVLADETGTIEATKEAEQEIPDEEEAEDKSLAEKQEEEEQETGSEEAVEDIIEEDEESAEEKGVIAQEVVEAVDEDSSKEIIESEGEQQEEEKDTLQEVGEIIVDMKDEEPPQEEPVVVQEPEPIPEPEEVDEEMEIEQPEPEGSEIAPVEEPIEDEPSEE